MKTESLLNTLSFTLSLYFFSIRITELVLFNLNICIVNITYRIFMKNLFTFFDVSVLCVWSFGLN